ncbi:MAG: autotransporter outer membrane beta-barrel domain-containing protein [Alphaproteobacteria bacterium]
MTGNKISLGVLAGAVVLGLNGPATTQQLSASASGAEIAALNQAQPGFALVGALPAFGSDGFGWMRAPQLAPAPTLFTSAPLPLPGADQKWSVGYRSTQRPTRPQRFVRAQPGWSAVVATAAPLPAGGAAGSASLTYQSPASWHLGAGIEASVASAPALGVAGGRQGYGIEAFAAFAPPGGLRVLASSVGAAAQSHPAPGASLVAAEPPRDVKAYGKSVQLSWEFDLYGASSLMPFARVDAFDTTLAPYAEARGPLPAEYYQTEDHVRVARIGIEGAAYAADNFRFWLRGNWGHRTQGTLAENTGKLFSFYTGFADPGLGAARDWGEAGIGLGWQIQPGMTIQASVGGASDGERDATVSGAFGLNWRSETSGC